MEEHYDESGYRNIHQAAASQWTRKENGDLKKNQSEEKFS